MSVENFRVQLEETGELLKRCCFFADKAMTVQKWIEAIVPLLMKEDLLSSTLTASLHADSELCFLAEQAVRRLKLFLNSFLVIPPGNQKVKFLQTTFVIINASSLQFQFCARVKDLVSMIKRILPLPLRKEIESDYKGMLTGTGRSERVIKFDELVGTMANRDLLAVEDVLLASLKVFFVKARKDLETQCRASFLPHMMVSSTVNVSDVKKLSSDSRLLSQAIEADLMKGLGMFEGSEVLITECSVQLDNNELLEGRIGDVVFHSAQQVEYKNAAQVNVINRGDEEIFLVLQQINLLQEIEDSHVLLPHAFLNFDATLSFIDLCTIPPRLTYKNVKMTLEQLLCNNKTKAMYNFTELEAVCVGLHVSSALTHLHNLGYSHNNLTARNVFICLRGRQAEAKIGNFAVCQEETLPIRRDLLLQVKGDELQAYEDIVYASPEILVSDDSRTSNDIYSLGMILWRLTHYRKDLVTAIMIDLQKTNILPKKQVAKLLVRDLLRGKRPKLDSTTELSGTKNETVRTKLMTLIGNCWDQDCWTRPSAEDVNTYLMNLFKLGRIVTENITETEQIFNILGEIVKNLRNGENPDLKQSLRKSRQEESTSIGTASIGNSARSREVKRVKKTKSTGTLRPVLKSKNAGSTLFRGLSLRRQAKSKKGKSRIKSTGRKVRMDFSEQDLENMERTDGAENQSDRELEKEAFAEAVSSANKRIMDSSRFEGSYQFAHHNY